MAKRETGFIRDFLLTGKHKDLRERQAGFILQYDLQSSWFWHEKLLQRVLGLFPQDNRFLASSFYQEVFGVSLILFSCSAFLAAGFSVTS